MEKSGTRSRDLLFLENQTPYFLHDFRLNHRSKPKKVGFMRKKITFEPLPKHAFLIISINKHWIHLSKSSKYASFQNWLPLEGRDQNKMHFNYGCFQKTSYLHQMKAHWKKKTEKRDSSNIYANVSNSHQTKKSALNGGKNRKNTKCQRSIFISVASSYRTWWCLNISMNI